MSKYGNLNDIPTTGASPETGRQDGENISGVNASEKLARTDLQRVNSYKEKIKSVSRKTGVDAAIIAAIMSRESRAGNVLDANKYGDNGNAFGLMQIDKRWHTPRGAWDSEEHLLQATEILTSMFDAIKKKFPSWSKSHVMKGALAAYNMGPDSVYSFDAVDSRTTGADYSNDCVARAKFYKRNGF
ncbi:lysozyme g-like isoform X4 [Rana temporaria]|uniref:lysozyme g-like isoform X4 n=1 Tax=Rana temporaria TaxID=8407 RepID=UPI001AAD7F45|nr:lysozyme g-like isoform X4 [Rana temporaria]